jgi:hypothetical protein
MYSPVSCIDYVQSRTSKWTISSPGCTYGQWFCFDECRFFHTRQFGYEILQSPSNREVCFPIPHHSPRTRQKDRQGSSVQCGTGCLSCGSGCAKTAPSRILQACKGPLPLSRILWRLRLGEILICKSNTKGTWYELPKVLAVRLEVQHEKRDSTTWLG